MRRTLGAVLAVMTIGSLLPAARANLLQSIGSKSISSLSLQVLAQPRSAAGRRKNVWDADPPEPANAGVHYFLYDMGADGKGIAPADQPAHFNAIVAGPGYNVLCQILLIDPTGTYGNGQPFYLGIPTSTDPDNPQNVYDPTAHGFIETGVVRIQFNLTGTAGQISGSTDSAELGYNGARDDSGNFMRGDEQARVVTSTTLGHDDDVIRGEMTATVPSDYVPGYTIDIAPGYLSFNEGTFTGDQVSPAMVTIPEPTTTAMAGLAGVSLARRRARWI